MNLERSILLVSAGLVHPLLPARFLLRRALATIPGYRFRRVASLEDLPSRPSFRAIVLYVHTKTISSTALERLDRFLQQGGGLLAIHAASASFKEEPRFFELLGGQFIQHGPVESFEVQPAEPASDLFAGIPSFSVTDELYRHNYDPNNHIHFYTTVGSEREPVVWTRYHSSGRVCYCSLGHTLNAMRHPQVWQILQRGLAWVCSSAGEAPA
jgi:type 1 glutamine amidotransferase